MRRKQKVRECGTFLSNIDCFVEFVINSINIYILFKKRIDVLFANAVFYCCSSSILATCACLVITHTHKKRADKTRNTRYARTHTPTRAMQKQMQNARQVRTYASAELSVFFICIILFLFIIII